MKNCGFSKEEALVIEERYHTLYKESDAYIAQRLKQASIDGYSTVAFGLRVRTPMLKQVLWNSDTVPYEAAAEGRTVGNAMGQSYGLLNTRATNAFMKRVWASKYRYKVLPINQIHDATYFLVWNDPEVIKWVNDNLIEEMQWQDLPEIQHPTVKLGAELDVFKDGWHKPITLPNKSSVEDIIKLLSEVK
jgi:DNA polymerase-1